jgi:hypothetical protein
MDGVSKDGKKIHLELNDTLAALNLTSVEKLNDPLIKALNLITEIERVSKRLETENTHLRRKVADLEARLDVPKMGRLFKDAGL